MKDSISGAHLDALNELIDAALRAGADAADALHLDSSALSVARRMGNPERLEREEDLSTGLRVLVGKRQALVSTNDFSPDTIADLVERAVAMARAVPEDPYCGLATPDQIGFAERDLEMDDGKEPDAEALIEAANAVEAAALAVEGVRNSEGGEASWSRTRISLASSNGFKAAYSASSHSLSVSVLAGEGGGMERAYDWSSTVHLSDLRSAQDIGRTAGQRAVARLGAKKLSTRQVPVVFDHRVSSGLVSNLLSAINGAAIARGTSFLKDSLGAEIFSKGVSIVEDPFIKRGLRSRLFDAEGLLPTHKRLIDDGRLTTWLLDLRSARQLGLAPTGNAARGAGSPPALSASNVFMEPGNLPPQEMIADIKDGVLIDTMFGVGVNMITGDYSRGCAGFRIENGEITHPVSGITIAGNLKDMFRNITPANDLVRRYGIDAPTLRIDGMTVAGE